MNVDEEICRFILYLDYWIVHTIINKKINDINPLYIYTQEEFFEKSEELINSWNTFKTPASRWVWLYGKEMERICFQMGINDKDIWDKIYKAGII